MEYGCLFSVVGLAESAETPYFRGGWSSRIRDNPNFSQLSHFEVTAADRSSGSVNRLEIRSYVD